MKKNLRLIAIIAVLMLLFLGACKNSGTDTTPVPTVTEDIILETVPVIETPVEPESVVTAAPASLVSGEIVLWAGAGSVHNSLLYERLSLLAQENGKSFQAVDGLTAEQITSTVRVVVSTASAAEIQTLASQFPQVEFLAVDVPGLSPATNLHLMTNEGGTLEQRSFLAGYALALTTDDYRVGAITLANDDVGNRTRDSFVTGVRYFCGLCNARFMPVDYYPYTAEVTDPTNQADWQAAVDLLLAKTVTAIYVQPEISSAELISYLASRNITVIGVEGQAGLEMASRLVGVFGSDIILSTEQAVLRIVAGDGVATGSGSLELKQINRDIMSEGKQMLFERIREELLKGYIKDRP